jgi:hypothetical protein
LLYKKQPVKLKLFFFFSFIFFIHTHAQSYIFGKITSENGAEMEDVNVINIRTDEIVLSNRDGHFMNIILVRQTIQIPEVEVKQGLTGNLKIDSKLYNKPKKVEKLLKDMDQYMAKKSDPRILAAKPGEFVQPKGQGFFIGKVKDKWDDVDLMKYIRASLGDDYFTNLKIEKPLIDHFIYYVFAGGFERKKILKYGFCSDADLNRFQRFVLTRISSYRAPQTKR